VFFPGIFVCSESGYHPLEAGVFFFFLFQFCGFEVDFVDSVRVMGLSGPTTGVK
jgi:hypothetical protein